MAIVQKENTDCSATDSHPALADEISGINCTYPDFIEKAMQRWRRYKHDLEREFQRAKDVPLDGMRVKRDSVRRIL